jgi:hypothetical protein
MRTLPAALDSEMHNPQTINGILFSRKSSAKRLTESLAKDFPDASPQ